MCVTKLDVLDDLEEIKVCTGYDDLNGNEIDFPTSIEDLEKITPRYEVFKGWQGSTRGIQEWSKLPEGARQYLHFISEATETPIDLVSTGGERDDSIIIRHPFATA